MDVASDPPVTVTGMNRCSLRRASDTWDLAENDTPASGICECHALVEPVRVLWRDRLMSQSRQAALQYHQMIGLRNVKNEKVIETGCRARAAVAMMRELEMTMAAGQAEHDPVVTVVVLEAV